MPWWWLPAWSLLIFNLALEFDDLLHYAKLKEAGCNVERKMAFTSIAIFLYGVILVSMILWGAGSGIFVIRAGYATCFLTFLLAALLISRKYIERKSRPK